MRRTPFLSLLGALACATAPRAQPAEPAVAALATAGAPAAHARPPGTAAASAAPAANGAAEEVVSAGGELREFPSATVVIEGSEVIAFGLAETPGDARLQAAQALAAANARAELLKYLRERIADSLRVRETAKGGASEPGEPEIEARTQEAARGVLPGLAPPRFGWRKVRRDGALVLQIWARLAAARALLDGAATAGTEAAKAQTESQFKK